MFLQKMCTGSFEKMHQADSGLLFLGHSILGISPSENKLFLTSLQFRHMLKMFHSAAFKHNGMAEPFTGLATFPEVFCF